MRVFSGSMLYDRFLDESGTFVWRMLVGRSTVRDG